MPVENNKGVCNNSFFIGLKALKTNLVSYTNKFSIDKLLEIPNLIINGGLVTKVDEITNDITLNNTYHTIICNPSSNIAITLPSALLNIGLEFIISNVSSSSNVSLNPNSTDLIVGQINFTLNSPYQCVSIKAYSSGWIII